MLVFAMLFATQPATVDARVSEAQRLLGDLEYQRALDEAKLAVVDAAVVGDARVDALLVGGIAAVVLGKQTEARLFFLDALRTRPAVELPPHHRDNPKIAVFFALVRAEAARASSSSPPSSSLDTGASLSLVAGAVAGAGLLVAAVGYGGALVCDETYRSPTEPVAARAQAQQAGAALLVTSWIGAAVGVVAGTVALAGLL